MKVLSSLYSVNSKTGTPVIWEFCETAQGAFCATNGYKLIRARDKDDLRRIYQKMSSYKGTAGGRRFSRTPVAQLDVA